MKTYLANNHFRLLICFLIGFLCCHLFYRFSESIFPPSSSWKKTIPVRVGDILPEEQWIHDYQLSATYLDEIYGRREYVSLILEPKAEIKSTEVPEKSARFSISGLSDQRSKIVFQISALDLKRGNGSQLILIINIPAPLFGPKSALLTDNLILDHHD